MNAEPKLMPIIGTGNLAFGLAYLLKKQGCSPSIIGREGPIEAVGYKFKGLGETVALNLPAASRVALKDSKVVFIAVKSYQLKLAILQHAPLFNAGTVFIPIGNGAIDKDLTEVAGSLPDKIVRIGVSTIAVSESHRGKLELRNKLPITQWGKLKDSDAELTPEEIELLKQGRPYFGWNPDIHTAYRKKWVFNTVINGVGAAFDCRYNGETLKHSQGLMKAFAESYSLAEQIWGAWPTSESPEPMFASLLQLIEDTFENENSMIRDIRLGRPTETSYLAGMANSYEDFEFLKELDKKTREKTSKEKGSSST